MKCTNCKNPISDNSTECEWCGCDVVQSNIKKTSSLEEFELLKINVQFIVFIDFELGLAIDEFNFEGKLKVGDIYLIEINNIKNTGKLIELTKIGGLISSDKHFNECNKFDEINLMKFQIENYNGGWKYLENEQTFVDDIKNFSFYINQI
jgi:hypothetical protein